MATFRRSKNKRRPTSSNVARRPKRERRLALEQCEPRNLLAVFTVTSPLDTGASGELRWAVNSANANPGADVIAFNDSANFINLTQGELPITDPVSINSLTAAPGFVTINAAANSRIFRIDDSNPNTLIPVNLNQLILRGGDLSSFPGGQGGTILNNERLTLETSFISESKAGDAGGAIANLGRLAVNRTDISESEAYGTGGGAIWNAPAATVTINGGSIYGNIAHGGSGGGILNDVAADVTITGAAEIVGNVAGTAGGGLALGNGSVADLRATLIQSNRSALGGGIHVDLATLTTGAGTRFFWNEASQGGGIAVTDFGSATMRGSVISGNLAAFEGGGIFASSFGSVEIIGGDITANQINPGGPVTGRGGGMFVDDFASITLQNAIVNYNGATAIPTGLFQGGGAFVGGAGTLHADASKFSGNVAFYGAGIYAGPSNGNTAADVYISNSDIEGNFAYTSGGGIYGARGLNLELKCVTITNNEALVLSGGGVQLSGDFGDGQINAKIRDSTISFNRAGAHGGGVASRGGVELKVENSIITENTAKELGAGFYLSGGSDVAGLNLTEIELSLISRNVASDPAGPIAQPRSGGGVWVGSNAALGISTTTIEANTAANNGGGIMVQGAAAFVLENSTVSGNESNNGGGAAVVRSDATFLQTTFYANRAFRDGGAIFAQSNAPHNVDVLHSTLSINSAAGSGIGRGGGIWAGSSGGAVSPINVNLDHTIVSTNLGAPLGGFDEIFDTGTLSGVLHVTADFSLIRDNMGTLLAPGNPDPNGNIIGSAGNPIDAQLGPLGNFGGPTLTMVPSNISPAINRGDPFFFGPPFTDQRLAPFQRVAAGVVDMGAVEVQPAPPTPDFDGNGLADCNDINALSTDIAAGLNTPAFDLTGDGFVDLLDLEKWLDDAPDINGIAIERYLPADSNLDTVVDGQDFVTWNLNKFTLNSNWCDGDFDANGVIDGVDFIIWNTFKFTQSPPLSGCGLFPNADALASREHRMDLSFLGFDDAGGEVAVDVAMSAYVGQAVVETQAMTTVKRQESTSTGFDTLGSNVERELAGVIEAQPSAHVNEALASRSRNTSGQDHVKSKTEHLAASSLTEHL